jgi:uncharacterized cysteine cluster protein YcgN (CxxCxxCC family)
MSLRPRFWERPLADLTGAEWEALCDGCGKCCMNKLEDEDIGDVAFTRVACRLFDDTTCQCTQYDIRHQFVPDCIQLKLDELPQHMYWLPQTCAYRLRFEGRPLFAWHPLISGKSDSVHKAGMSMFEATVSEFDTPEDDWEDHIVEEPQ